MASMQEKIEQKLTDAFKPQHLQVVNQSKLHQGHAGDDGSGESHFHVELSSEYFDGMSRVQAQRAVYDVLSEELQTVHALSLTVKI